MSVEATRNPRLRKVLMQHQANRHQLISEFIELQMKKGFIRKEIDRDAIALGLIGLYEGLVINKVTGAEYSSNKKAWSNTIRAIFAGIGY
jgi:hypothetical protein